MEKIKIRYKKRIRRGISFLVLGWLVIGISVFFVANQQWMGYIYLAIGLFSLILYFYFLKNQYLTIKNGILTKNNMLLSKSIPLNEVKEVKYFAGDYTLMTDRDKLTIETDPVDKVSLDELKAILDGLDAKMRVITPN